VAVCTGFHCESVI